MKTFVAHEFFLITRESLFTWARIYAASNVGFNSFQLGFQTSYESQLFFHLMEQFFMFNFKNFFYYKSFFFLLFLSILINLNQQYSSLFNKNVIFTWVNADNNLISRKTYLRMRNNFLILCKHAFKESSKMIPSKSFVKAQSLKRFLKLVLWSFLPWFNLILFYIPSGFPRIYFSIFLKIMRNTFLNKCC